MNRTTIFYVIMLTAGGAALWLVLSATGTVSAPPDISGEWTLHGPTENAGADTIGTAEVPTSKLRIEQSGRFARLRREHGDPRDYALSVMSPEDGGTVIELRGESDTFIFMMTPDRQAATVRHTNASGRAIELAARHTVRAGMAPASSATESGHAQATPGHRLVLVLLAGIAVILGSCQIMGRLFERIGQPKVIGEMVAGVMLGPSLFGWVWPAASQALFPADTTQYLSLLSQIGVIFFLFLIGLELDPKLLRNRGHSAVVVSHASIIAPFVLGAVLAIYLYPILFNDAPRMRFSSVALFMGAAMSITAFPVLARILTERNLHKTPVGAVTITCAAVDDVTAWCMLAFVVGFARAEGAGPAIVTAVLSVAYVGAMIFLVRPLLFRLEQMRERQGALTSDLVAIIFLLVLASAYATEAIGIHALFGAFLMGAIMPKGTLFVRELTHKLEDFTVILLLPIFFAYTGLKTQIGLLNSMDLWMLTGLIILVACVGKFGGSTLAARACGLNWRESAAIGILMNTRGLMELVILNIGRELGVITDAVFAMMVIMAVVTTFLTTPILNWVYPDRLLRAARRRPTAPDAYVVLIPVSLPRSAKPLIRLADVITGPDDDRRAIIGLHLRRAREQEAYRAAVNDDSAEEKAPLDVLVRAAHDQGVPIEPISFVAREPAADIAQVAEEQRARLILMGFHNPVLGQTFLGGTVHRVLEQAAADVAIFIDRGLHDKPRTILVPYLGSPHDRLALDTAARMGRHSGAAVTILHVTSPERHAGADAADRLKSRVLNEKSFADPTQSAPVHFKVVANADPIAAVLEHAKPFDLVVIGIAEEWGLTSQLFGWRAERIARDCPSSLLIMRKYVAPASAATPAVEPKAGPAPMHYQPDV